MAKRFEVYKCSLCGKIVQVHEGTPVPTVCCGQDMNLLEEKSADMSTEKHVPVITPVEGGYKVTVGSTLHPMTEEHLIQWVELITENKTMIHYFKAGDTPEATFMTDEKVVSAREHCNLHGLWKNTL